ncbi:uncharacterized protein [Penaeus vannamei]|uniref:uncharacterized protein isoform X2 n=1 Tax=Penaeus vannamei TaxID=6689 RepID=UPI00387F3A2F
MRLFLLLLLVALAVGAYQKADQNGRHDQDILDLTAEDTALDRRERQVKPDKRNTAKEQTNKEDNSLKLNVKRTKYTMDGNGDNKSERGKKERPPKQVEMIDKIKKMHNKNREESEPKEKRKKAQRQESRAKKRKQQKRRQRGQQNDRKEDRKNKGDRKHSGNKNTKKDKKENKDKGEKDDGNKNGNGRGTKKQGKKYNKGNEKRGQNRDRDRSRKEENRDKDRSRKEEKRDRDRSRKEGHQGEERNRKDKNQGKGRSRQEEKRDKDRSRKGENQDKQKGRKRQNQDKFNAKRTKQQKEVSEGRQGKATEEEKEVKPSSRSETNIIKGRNLHNGKDKNSEKINRPQSASKNIARNTGNIEIQDVCAGKIVLGYGESVVIYTNNDRQKEKCKNKIKTPEGSEIGFFCPFFNLNSKGCKREQLKFRGKVNGKKQNKKYCKLDAPDGVIISTNKLSMEFRRKQFKSDEFSGGFLCEIYTVGDAPTIAPSTTASPPPTTVPPSPTTAPPSPTTAPPSPTTAPPSPTTAPPSPTTAPPSPTTAPPSPTTAPPSPTTAPPSPTTAPPSPTTAPPSPTTAPPSPTTAPPSPTTAPPSPTTAPPSPTTAPPSPTTAPPSPTTAPPSPTTAPPSPTTAPPSPTTAPPSPTTAPPSPTTTPPSPTTAPPSPTTAPPSPTTAPPSPTTAPPPPGTTTCSITREYCDGCGVAPISVGNTRIVNGTAASVGEYPYQVAVLSTIAGRQYQCGGSIIKERWILTAAHCFYDLSNNKATSVDIIYGTIDINGGAGTTVTASRFIDHPGYDSSTYANDIALVELPQPLNYATDANIQPICLGQEEDIPFGGKAVASGWGALSFGGSSPDILQEVELDIITINECQQKVSLPPDTNSVVCALTLYKDTCQGDSGGPLVAKLCDGTWAQIGIVSYGFQCAVPDNPGVYTRVSTFASWISDNTGGSSCSSTLTLSAELDNRAKEREAVNEAKNEVVRIGQDLDGLETTLNAASGRRRRRRNLTLLQELATALINLAPVLLSRNVQRIISLSSELAALRGRLVVFNAEVAAGASGLDVPALLAGVGSAKQTAQNATKVARQELADIEVEIQVIVVEFENSGSTVPPLPSLEPEPTVKPVTPTASSTAPPTTAPPSPTTAPPVPTTAPPSPTTAPPSPTTAPPVPTTAPPSPTTAPPSPTTAPPVPTTAPPSPTTAPPSPTTTPPSPTTAPPVPTTVPPSPTTAPPSPTTAPPSPTTTPPSPTTTPPSPTTAPPSPTTAPPSPTTAPPSPTTAPPSPTTAPPSPTTAPPSPTTAPPSPTTTPPSPTTAPPSPTTTPLSPTTTPPSPTTAPPSPTTTPPSPTTAPSPGTTTCSITREYCDGCGVAPISVGSTRIVNGTAASVGEYPYQVAVLSTIAGQEYQCGGSIIKERWILTAAHCFYDLSNNKATSVDIIYGTIDINGIGGTRVTASRFIDHPGYDSSTKANDIALVELPQPLNYASDANIQPICLGQEEDIPFGGKAVASGWGALSFEGSSPDVLQEVELDIITINECQQKESLPPDTNSVVCALTLYKDTCQGDSGGPLVAKLCDGTWAQIGIVSYGFQCAVPGKPGVYTRVSAFASWISNNTGGSSCSSTLTLSAELDNRAKEREAVNEAKNEVVRIGQDLDGLETTLNATRGRRRRRRNLTLLQELTTALNKSADVLLSRNVQRINSLSSELAALRGRLVVFTAQVAAGASGLDVPALLAGVGSAKQTAQDATKVARQELAEIEVEIQIIVAKFENSGSTVPPLPSLEPEPTVKPVTPTTSPTTPPPTTPNVPTTIAPSTTASPPTPTTAPPSPGTSTCSITREYCNGCGVAPISVGNTKIVNGTAASVGEYPYQVAVLSTIAGRQYPCGGSIIKERWILTAAHCFYDNSNNKATSVDIIYGTIDINGIGGTRVTASRFIDHPGYDSSTYANDIALVELPQPLNYATDAKIQPICLGLEEDIPFGGKAVASGWGDLSFEGLSPDVLQEVELDIITINECQQKESLPPDTNSVVCALTLYKDTCQGDSGGPLVAKLCDGTWAQIGIVSYGFQCAVPGKPGVYTRVSAFASWISNNTGGSSCSSTLTLSAELDNRAKEREAVNEAKNEVVRIGQDLDGLETTLNATRGRRRRRRNLTLLQELTTALNKSADVLLSRNVQRINSLSSELAALRGRLVVFTAQVAAGASGLDVPALLAGVGSAKQTAQNATKVARQELAEIEVEIQIIVAKFENSGSTVPPLPSLEPEPTVKPVTPTTSPTTPPPTTPNVPTTIAPSTTASPPTPTTAPPSPGTSTCSITREYCNGCGVAPISVGSTKIVNGTVASVGEYPYQVGVLPTIAGLEYRCGGSIIKERWILTAAHCFYDNSKNKATSVDIIYGTIYINGSDGTRVTASRFIDHPGYNSSTNANDIALVELPQPLNYATDAKIQPICLGLQEDIPFGGKAVASGWGDLSFDGLSPNVLQEVELDIITIDECQQKESLPPDTNSVVCALTLYKDTCQGDSGGPLVAKLCDGTWAQIGIVSYGFQCAVPDKPGVYTRVSAFASWISNNTGGSSCSSTLSKSWL